MNVQIEIALIILSALLTGGFIIFFVENRQIEKDVIDRYRSIMDPYYHKLSNYLKLVFFINNSLIYKESDIKNVEKFKSYIEKLAKTGKEVFLTSNIVSYKESKELDLLNESINAVWWLYYEGGVDKYIDFDNDVSKALSTYILDAIIEISPSFKGIRIDENLIPFVSGEFYVNLWKPVKGITFDFEDWEKKCNSNKRLLFFSIAFVMIIMICTMLFYPILKCIYLITIPTMLCCVTFMFLLFRLNNLMKLSQSVF